MIPFEPNRLKNFRRVFGLQALLAMLEDDLDKEIIQQQFREPKLLEDLILVALRNEKITKDHPLVTSIGQQNMVDRAKHMHEQVFTHDPLSAEATEPTTGS